MAMQYQCIFYGKFIPQVTSLEIQNSTMSKLVCKVKDTMLPMQLVYRKNMQLLERIYGQVNKTVAVHCTDILEQKAAKDQSVYFLQEKNGVYHRHRVPNCITNCLIHLSLYLLL